MNRLAAMETLVRVVETGSFCAAARQLSGNDLAPLIEQALRDRPELANYRDQRDSALRLARSLRDARLPTISAVIATGDAPSHDVRLPDTYTAGGLRVGVPLFAGGLYQARQREAELRAKAAGESLRAVQDNVTRDVRIAWLNLNNSRERLRTSARIAATGARYDVLMQCTPGSAQATVRLSPAFSANCVPLTVAQLFNAWRWRRCSFSYAQIRILLTGPQSSNVRNSSFRVTTSYGN